MNGWALAHVWGEHSSTRPRLEGQGCMVVDPPRRTGRPWITRAHHGTTQRNTAVPLSPRPHTVPHGSPAKVPTDPHGLSRTLLDPQPKVITGPHGPPWTLMKCKEPTLSIAISCASMRWSMPGGNPASGRFIFAWWGGATCAGARVKGFPGAAPVEGARAGAQRHGFFVVSLSPFHIGSIPAGISERWHTKARQRSQSPFLPVCYMPPC